MSSKKYENLELPYKSALGARIRAARLAGGEKRTQQWLADLLAIPKSRISEWETGKWSPQAETLMKIATATGCDPAWLLRGDYQVRQLPAPAVAEPPPVWPGVPPELEGDRRLEKAARELMEVLLHAERDDVAALLKNIEVFARDARAHQEPKRRRRAG